MTPTPPTSGAGRGRWAIALAAAVLVLPPAVARYGPTSWRVGLRSLQSGELFGTATATELVFDRIHGDFGSVVEGRSATVRFRFQNGADQPVTFTHHWTTCGCLQVEAPGTPIPPGGSGEVVLHIDTKDRLKGSMWQMAKLYTDRAPTAPYLLMVEGAVR